MAHQLYCAAGSNRVPSAVVAAAESVNTGTTARVATTYRDVFVVRLDLTVQFQVVFADWKQLTLGYSCCRGFLKQQQAVQSTDPMKRLLGQLCGMFLDCIVLDRHVIFKVTDTFVSVCMHS